ncbi:DUF4435 domain-containing protein [Citrobacter braakii]|uniref:DUF4435 domain-containing protein n=1 Tax=Citrobacter braakii TaxID=57706 RepID=UPI002B3D1463|nr:DUF4435 domain-containing protein [Citrobacter braakii]MEB2721423.1 DUF4435 domain-containing protein [Citrobacter braakii]
MAGIPTYDIEENLRRIDMQRSLKFVVVEGSDDVPIYENIVSSVTANSVDFEVIHSGGKPRIKTFLSENPKTRNCIFIIDRDFDIFDGEFENLVYLERYSIENFYFCEDVLKAVVAMSVKVKLNVAHEILDLQSFIDYSTPILLRLFFAIYYYQQVEAKRLFENNLPVESWSEAFICQDDNWRICPNKIQTLISRLYPNGYDETVAENYYNEQYTSSGKVIEDFPGKMLKVALQRYLKDTVIKLNPKFGSKFSNTDVTCTLLMSNLHRSRDLNKNLEPVYNFLLG